MIGNYPKVPRPKNHATLGASPILFVDTSSSDHGPVIELLSIAEAATLLSVSISSVRRLQQGRHLPFIRVGGSVRFAKVDLFAYLKRRRVESLDPINS